MVSKNYYVAQVSFYVNEDQTRISQYDKDWIDKNIPDHPFSLLTQIIQKHPNYEFEKLGRGISFEFANFIFDEDEKLIAAKIGHEGTTHIPKKDDHGDYINPEEITNPHVPIIFDWEQQTLIIQKSSSVFQNIESLIHSLEIHFNFYLDEYNVHIKIYLKKDKNSFWNIVDSYSHIYSFTIILNEPNLFGNTNETAKEILEKVKKSNNGQSISQTIKNKDGNLTFSKNDISLTDAIDYTNKGGGSWEMEVSIDTTKTTLKSEETPLEYVSDSEIDILDHVTANQALLDIQPNYYISNISHDTLKIKFLKNLSENTKKELNNGGSKYLF